MASIKECDRCGKQWNPEKDATAYSKGDTELCHASISIPRDPRRTNRPEVNKSVELCQDCARHIAKQLEPAGRASDAV